MKKQEQQKILSELSHNSGTENYFKIPFSTLVYTDGINDLINKCKCWWLISDIGILIQNKKDLFNKAQEFLILSLKVNDDNTAILSLKEDSDLKPVYTQEIEYTDFPLKEYEFYIVNNVMLLKEEY